MKNKYNIDKSFGLFRYFKTPDSKFIAYLGKLLIPFFDLWIKSDKNVIVKKIKLKNKDHKVTSYLIIPRSLINKKSKCLIYIHGGGFIFSAVPHQYKNAKQYALKSNSIVFFMKYKLIKPYPASINDIMFLYDNLISNHEKYNLDINNLGIAGDSAGGYLALDLLNRKRDKLIKFILLFYPFLDDDLTSPSMKKFKDTPMWNSLSSKKVINFYFKNNGEVFFNKINDLSFVPDTYIETCEFDCLYDQDIEFYKKINNNLREVILNETKKTMHGYDIASKSLLSKKEIAKRIDVLNHFFNKNE